MHKTLIRGHKLIIRDHEEGTVLEVRFRKQVFKTQKSPDYPKIHWMHSRCNCGLRSVSAVHQKTPARCGSDDRDPENKIAYGFRYCNFVGM